MVASIGEYKFPASLDEALPRRDARTFQPIDFRRWASFDVVQVDACHHFQVIDFRESGDEVFPYENQWYCLQRTQ